MVTVTAPHLHMGWVRAIRNTALCSRMQSTGTGGSNPVSSDHEKLVLEPFGHSASHCSSVERRGCLFHIFTPKFLPDNPAGISWLSGKKFYFKICHTRPQKIKGFICPFGLKIRRVGRSIFYLFFLKIWTQKKCSIIHVCAFLGTQSPRIGFSVGLGYIPLYLVEVPFWYSFIYILTSHFNI